MKKTLLLVLVSCISLGLTAQKTLNVKKIDSRDIIQKGVELFEKEDYDGAIAQYLKVPAGDPFYEYAKYEIAYAQYQKEDYQGTINSLKEIVNSNSNTVNKWQIYLLLGDAYSLTKQYDKAMEIFNLASASYPYSWELYYYKGLTNYKMEQYEEAKANFAKTLFINPANTVAHYYYGMSNINLGYTIPGILALNYCTVIQPEHRAAISALQELDAIYSNGIDLYNKDNNIVVSPEYEEKNELYADITAMLNSTFATLPGFRSLSKIKHRVVASNQIVFSEVKQRPGSHTIEDQLYVPSFTKVMANKQYNALSYLQFSATNLDNGKVMNKAKSMSSVLTPLVNQLTQHLEETISHGLGIENPDDTFYTYTNLRLKSWGMRNPNRTDEVIEEGTWHTIQSNGQMESIGYFVNGKPNGPATIYKNNIVEKEVILKDGKMNGIYREYAYDPLKNEKVLTFICPASAGSYEGDYKTYNTSGILVSEGTLSSDEMEGECKRYNDQGVLSEIGNFKDGEPTGSQKDYFENGQLKADYVIGAKNERTFVRYYHPNGKIKTESELLNMTPVGNYKSYFPNGALESSSELDDNGDVAGEMIVYYRNGNKSIESASPNSPVYFYDSFGRLNYSTDRNKDQTTKVTTYNPDQSVRETYPMKGKRISFDIYTDYNIRKATISMNAKRENDGLFTFYYLNGNVKEKRNYKNGQPDGSTTTYYPNGRIKSYAEYSNGTINGLYVKYYNNEKNSVSKEAIYRNDTIYGASYDYYFDGAIKSVTYNNNDGEPTYYCNYFPNGDKQVEIQFLNAMPSIFTYYGKSNQVIAQDTLYNGNGTFKSYFLNGAVKDSCQMVAGLRHGTSYLFDMQGKTIDSTRFISNLVEGILRGYDMTGNLKYEDQYSLGQTNGVLKHYYANGNLFREAYCEADEYQGIQKEHYISGELYAEVNYLEDERNGVATYYAPDGNTVIYEIKFENDQPLSYSALQKDGKMSDFAPIGSEPLTITAYYASGKTAAILNYDKGMPNGSTTIYYANGQAARMWSYKDDLLNGKTAQYYPNGKIWYQNDFIEDMSNGLVQFFYDNGQVQYEYSTVNDMVHGDVNTYDKNGKLTRTIKVYYDDAESDTRH